MKSKARAFSARGPTGRQRVRHIPVSKLTPRQIDEMWALYEAFYDHVEREVFDQDLARKQFVLLGTEVGTGAVVGFSNVRIFEHEHEGKRVGLYFTGDTVFHPNYWGDKGLHWATLREWVSWKLRHPRTPLYWYLICSGYRTYLSLVRNFPTHWPHHLRPTPGFERGLLDAIGRRSFGELWHPETGLISTGEQQPVFKPEFAPITPKLAALPEIKFFFEHNPHHARGDELAMIALVDGEAVTWMVRRWLSKAVRRLRGRRRPSAESAR